MQRQRSTSHTFDDRISEYRVTLKGQLAAASNVEERQRINRKLRQLDIAADINEWLSSPGLGSPRLRTALVRTVKGRP